MNKVSVIKTYSKIGVIHQNEGGENQDALRFEQTERFAVISLADGVSSCRESKTGAEIASKAITGLFIKLGESLFERKDSQIAEFVLSHILYELNKRANEDSQMIEEYSSTIASVFIDKRTGRLLCFNLGDGIIMATHRGKCFVLEAPIESPNGCCTTTTQGVQTKISISKFEMPGVESIIICSDGAWRDMYSKNKLKDNPYLFLVSNSYDELESFLMRQDHFDDSSFISLSLREPNVEENACLNVSA